MTAHRALVLLLATACVTGCTKLSIVRIQKPGDLTASGPPTLEKAIDLGALPPAEQGLLGLLDSDGVLTPGEYVALLGSELGLEPQVTISGKPMAIAGYLAEGWLLVRVPRGVLPGIQEIALDNGRGKAVLPVQVTSFIWGADTRGDALRFRMLGAEHLKIEKRDLDIEFPKARYGALSPDASLLFAVQEPNYEGAFTPEVIGAVVNMVAAASDPAGKVDVMVVHMGGKGGPRPAASLTLELESRPTGIAAGPRGLVVVLERRHLTVIDASLPTAPKVLSRLLVADGEPRELADAEFLGDGTKLVVLEAYENKVHLVDLADPAAPRVTSAISLANPQDEPFSIDLAPAPGGKSVWALQGPNLRLAGKKLKEGAGKLWTSVKLGFKPVPGSEPVVDAISRVVEVSLDPAGLKLTKSVNLPKDIFPFFVSADPKTGYLFVSALHGQNPFEKLTANLDGVVKLLEALRDTAQFSRVIAIDPATGGTETVLQSIAIYYEVTPLPTGKLCASLTRLGPGFIPPRITLDWGFEVVDGEFVKLREVANTGFGIVEAIARLLPPYRYERVGAQ